MSPLSSYLRALGERHAQLEARLQEAANLPWVREMARLDARLQEAASPPAWLQAVAEKQTQYEATLKDAFRPMAEFTEWLAEREALFKMLVPQWLPRDEGVLPQPEASSE